MSPVFRCQPQVWYSIVSSYSHNTPWPCRAKTPNAVEILWPGNAGSLNILFLVGGLGGVGTLHIKYPFFPVMRLLLHSKPNSQCGPLYIGYSSDICCLAVTADRAERHAGHDRSTLDPQPRPCQKARKRRKRKLPTFL